MRLGNQRDDVFMVLALQHPFFDNVRRMVSNVAGTQRFPGPCLGIGEAAGASLVFYLRDHEGQTVFAGVSWSGEGTEMTRRCGFRRDADLPFDRLSVPAFGTMPVPVKAWPLRAGH